MTELPKMPPRMYLERCTRYYQEESTHWLWRCFDMELHQFIRHHPLYELAPDEDFIYVEPQQAADDAWGWWDRYCMERPKT